MRTNILETLHPVHCAPSGTIAANEDIYNGSPASDVVSLADAQGAAFLIIQNANGSGGNAYVNVQACDDTTPSNTTNMSFHYRSIEAADTLGNISEAKSFATSTAADMAYVVEVDAAEAPAGYPYCRLKLTEKTNQPVDGAVFGFLTGLRYKEAGLGTQVT